MISLFLVSSFLYLFLSPPSIPFIQGNFSKEKEASLDIQRWIISQIEAGELLENLNYSDIIFDHSDSTFSNLIILNQTGFEIFKYNDYKKSLFTKTLTDFEKSFGKVLNPCTLIHYEFDRDQNQLISFFLIQEPGNDFIVYVLFKIDKPVQAGRIRSIIGMILLLLLLVSLCIFAVFLWFIFIKPLIVIKNTVISISRGSYEVNLNLKRKDEVGELSRYISQMAYAVRDIETNSRLFNPLTELPGNTRIEYWIREKLADSTPFCLININLDRFKPFNDVYGFNRGDELLLFTAQVIKDAVFTNATEVSFVGHKGGDDFIVTCPFEQWELICQKIIREFEHNIQNFYNSDDRSRGFIHSSNRKGEESRFELISISLAVVSNFNREFSGYAEIATVVSELKKQVKNIPGSAYSIDKRCGI